MVVRYGMCENTARMFMLKVREAIKSSGKNPMDGAVHIDEFVVGGKENEKPGRSYDSKKKKPICAVQLTEDGKVKRFYAQKIEDFSSKSLRKIFTKRLDKNTQVTTDQWKGYRPITKDYDITQIPSDKGLNFKALHDYTSIKSWIRTTYSWISEPNIERYFNEFCYRINRSQSKNTIFNNLIVKMTKASAITHKQIISN